MNRDEIVQRMAAAFAKVTEQTPPAMPDELQLKEGLGLDSFSALELLFELEESLNIRIPQDQSTGFRTVGDVVAFVQAQLQSAAAPALEQASS